MLGPGSTQPARQVKEAGTEDNISLTAGYQPVGRFAPEADFRKLLSTVLLQNLALGHDDLLLQTFSTASVQVMRDVPDG
ncbi:hypothetical protein NMY22_g1617 [Coprinellus aureogranulatus]|nr:hypothetical protein NMY22_g1617 [Coprinellus aureogranulatus]